MISATRILLAARSAPTTLPPLQRGRKPFQPQSQYQTGGAQDAHLPTMAARAQRHIEQLHAADEGLAAEQRVRGEPVTAPKRGNDAILEGKLKQAKAVLTRDDELALEARVQQRMGKADKGIVIH